MANQRKRMRQIREILRLRREKELSFDKIASALRMSKRTVRLYVERADRARLTWPLPETMDDGQLEQLLFPVQAPTEAQIAREIDFEAVEKGLKSRKFHVTRQLLWSEYSASHPDGYSYPHFCRLHREWRKSRAVSMRQQHEPGRKLFIDFAGDTMNVRTAVPGEIRKAQIFVATLGYSNYTWVEAMWQQDSAATLGAVSNALEYFSGVPEVIVPDNMKTAVKKPGLYEAEIARPFEELAQHYSMAVLPARSRKPRDKAKVESAVGHVERSVLAVLRHRTFFSLKELNEAILEQLTLLNAAPFQGREESRVSLFEEEKGLLQPLPQQRYEYATWKQAKVHPDSHIQVSRHCYSVPSTYVHRQVDVRTTAHVVEVFFGGKRIASHQRSVLSYGSTTVAGHLPSAHQAYAAQQTPEYYLERARDIGPCMEELLIAVMGKKKHPELGFRACLGILSLARPYPRERMESAAQRALLLGSFSYSSMKSILEKGLDQRPYLVKPRKPPILHENLRGASYYAQGEIKLI